MSDDYFNIELIRPVIEEMMPLEEVAKYDVAPPDYSAVATVGDRLVQCSRCGAILDPDSGATTAHTTWHDNIGLVVWLIQGFIVSHMIAHEEEADGS